MNVRWWVYFCEEYLTKYTTEVMPKQFSMGADRRVFYALPEAQDDLLRKYLGSIWHLFQPFERIRCLNYTRTTVLAGERRLYPFKSEVFVQIHLK